MRKIMENGRLSVPDLRRTPKATIGVVFLLIATSIWGASYVVVKDILEVMNPIQYIIMRFLFAVPVAFIINHKSILKWLRSTMCDDGSVRRFARLVFPGACLCFAFITQSFGLQGSTPAIAALITSLVFCVLPVFEYLYGDRPGLGGFFIPWVCALSGLSLITKFWDSSFHLHDIALLASTVFYAAHIFYTGRYARDVDGGVIFFFQATVVLSIAIVFGVFEGEGIFVYIESVNILRILYVSIVATFIAYRLQIYAQKYVRPRYVGLLYVAEPVVAVFTSVILGYDALSMLLVLGGLLVSYSLVRAVLLAQLDPKNI